MVGGLADPATTATVSLLHCVLFLTDDSDLQEMREVKAEMQAIMRDARQVLNEVKDIAANISRQGESVVTLI